MNTTVRSIFGRNTLSCSAGRQSITEGCQGRTSSRTGRQELKQGIWRTVAYCCSSWLAQPDFLEHSEPPAQGWHEWQLAGSAHINHYQENRAQTCLQDILIGGIFSIKIPSTKICIRSCQADKTTSAQLIRIDSNRGQQHQWKTKTASTTKAFHSHPPGSVRMSPWRRGGKRKKRVKGGPLVKSRTPS